MDVNRRELLVTTLLLVFVPALAAAEAAIDEIQVTASRRALERSEVSSAVSVIDNDRALRTNLITDALAAQPGSYLQETTPGQGAVIIRGLKGSEVLHLVDGIRMNNAIFRNAPTQYAALIDPFSIERIEMVRGSGASLYGSSAMGGVVNFLTRRPSPGESGLRNDLGVSANTADLARKISYALEIPRDNMAALAQLTLMETGNRRTGSGDRIGASGFESGSARVAMTFETNDERSWFLDFHALEQPETARVDELVAGFGETEPGSSEFFFEPNARYFAHVEHRATNALWGADWKFDLAWQRIVDDRRSRAYESTERRLEKNRSDLLLLDMDASWQVGETEWLFGAEWTDDRVRSSRTLVNLVSGERAETASRFPDDSRVRQGAVYTNVRLTAADRHFVTAGVRYNLTRVTAPSAGSAPEASLRFDNFSGDIGWIFQASESIRLVANLGRGFRAPNIFDLGTLGERPGNRFNVPNSDLEAERVLQSDIGLKLFDERSSLEVFLFRLDYEDRIESIATGELTADGRSITQSRNLASSDLYGIEASGFLQLTDAIAATANVTWTKGTSQLAGEQQTDADRVPPLNGRLQVVYEPNERWQGVFRASFADRQDELSPRDVSDPRINPEGTAGWLVLGTEFTWFRNDWRFTLGADNILDASYRVHGSGVDARGRNLFGSVEYRW